MEFQTDGDDVMSEINMTPFVDIMLVLLVVFIVTLPVMKHSINLDLPKVSSVRLVEAEVPLRIHLYEDGKIYLDKDLMSLEDLQARLKIEGEKTEKPVIQIMADKNVRYELIAELLGFANKFGINKIGFVTEMQKDSGLYRESKFTQ